MIYRQITSFNPAQPTTDGAGVAIQRVAVMGLSSVDPVLMIDELKSPFREDFQAGFPAHPHRGMQTLTYMLAGGIAHEDSMGNRGEIREGGVQWMSAGSGVIHSEMPTQDTTGLHGFQLWFNLPSEMKMSAPRYRDIPSTALPQVSADRSSLTAIAGDWRVDDHRIAGPLHELAPIAQMADLSLDAFADATFEISSTSNAMVFVFEGAVETSSQTLPAPGLAVFERDCRNNSKSGDAEQNLVTVRASNAGARCLLLIGDPIGEPVVHYGPFVMNTRAEIETALHEYRSGTFLKH